MTAPTPSAFDTTMAKHIASVSLDALAEMAKAFAENGNVQGLQTIIDIGVLDNDGRTRGSYVPDRLVQAIYPLMFGDRYESRPEFFNDWLSRCAQSNPEAVADIAYDLVAHDRISASNFPKFLAACGLDFLSPMPDDEPMIISANNTREYQLNGMTLGGALVLRKNGSVCTRAMVKEMGLKGSLSEFPVMTKAFHKLDSGEIVERTLNLLDLTFLGNSPGDAIAADERVRLVLSMLDMSQPHVRSALTDALVRAIETEVFDTEGSFDAADMVVLAIDAGCELQGRDDLVAGRGLPIGNGESRLPLLAHLVSARVKDADEDYPPTNAQFVNAARRLIEEGGADPSAFAAPNLTALHYAVIRDNRPMVEMLLEHGADASAKGADRGIDALETARISGSAEIPQVILAWSARQAVERVIGAPSRANKGVG